MSLFGKDNISLLMSIFDIGCFHFYLIQIKGVKQNYGYAFLDVVKTHPYLNTFFDNLIYQYHTLEGHFYNFFLPKIISTFLHTFSNSKGSNFVDTIETIL